jgi:hypothetical protein
MIKLIAPASSLSCGDAVLTLSVQTAHSHPGRVGACVLYGFPQYETRLCARLPGEACVLALRCPESQVIWEFFLPPPSPYVGCCPLKNLRAVVCALTWHSPHIFETEMQERTGDHQC